jgi:hypothetical protein
MKRRALLSSALVVALTTGSLPVSAQVTSIPIDTAVTSLLGDQLRYNNNLINLRKSVNGNSPNSHGTPIAIPTWPHVTVTNSTFNPITHFTTAGPPTVPDVFAAKVPDASKRPAVANLLRGMLKEYDRELTQENDTGRRNDLAGAYTFATQAAYYVATNGTELSEAQQNGVLAQMSNAIVNGSNARDMTDAQKQQTYEGAVILGNLLIQLYKYSKQNGDTAMAASDRKMADQFLTQLFGVPSSELRFDARGAIHA